MPQPLILYHDDWTIIDDSDVLTTAMKTMTITLGMNPSSTRKKRKNDEHKVNDVKIQHQTHYRNLALS